MKRNVIIIVLVALILVMGLYFSLNNGSDRTLIVGGGKSGNELIELSEEVVVRDLDTVWAIDFLPSGEMVFTERKGVVSLWDGENVETIGEIDVSEVSESGLAGIAVDPNFESNNFIYVYYTTKESGNRVSRFNLEENKLISEKILLENIPSSRFHDGGRIKFGPDYKLYITTGDATDPASSQDIDSLAGKILRMNSDGSVPEDNPFDNYVWSYGHRNPQGIAWHPETGELFEAEHGPTRNDEINIIRKRHNFGWPSECTEFDEADDTNVVNAIRCFSEFTLAPSGIAFHNGDLYVGGLRGTQVRRIVFDGNSTNIIREAELFSDLGRIREVASHDGYLYIGTSNRDGRGVPRFGDDKIIRVRID